MTTISLYGVTLDCPDPQELAQFYSVLTGYEITWSSPEAAALSGEGGLPINFQQVADFTPPEWPGQRTPQQFHLDFTVTDLDEAVAKVIALGAKPADFQPGEGRWRVMLDPAGHPFCLAASGG
jgi:predicted enzyme related to lactoylglutathione lyase